MDKKIFPDEPEIPILPNLFTAGNLVCNMILCDRKQLKNQNGLILGTPGSGKSFAQRLQRNQTA